MSGFKSKRDFIDHVQFDNMFEWRWILTHHDVESMILLFPDIKSFYFVLSGLKEGKQVAPIIDHFSDYAPLNCHNIYKYWLFIHYVQYCVGYDIDKIKSNENLELIRDVLNKFINAYIDISNDVQRNGLLVGTRSTVFNLCRDVMSDVLQYKHSTV